MTRKKTTEARELTIAGYDYAGLKKSLRNTVKRQAAAIRALVKTTAESIVEIGIKLKAVKECLPHGQFLPWLQAEFEWSESTAQNFMRVADRFAGQDIAHIAPSALYLLASPSVPEPVVNEALARAGQGERVTRRAILQFAARDPDDEIDDDRESADFADLPEPAERGRAGIVQSTGFAKMHLKAAASDLLWEGESYGRAAIMGATKAKTKEKLQKLKLAAERYYEKYVAAHGGIDHGDPDDDI